MKKTLFLFSLCSSVVLGQNALSKAQVDLDNAQRKFQQVSSEIALEEAKLVREVESLDDKVIDEGRELRELERSVASISNKSKRLETELKARETEFDFYSASFNKYAREFKNQLHLAEFQTFDSKISNIQSDIESAGEDLSLSIQKSIPLIEMGIDRLLDVAGGKIFDGNAQSADSTLVEGKFAVIGPVGYFSSKDGSSQGMTSFASGEVKIPSLLDVNDKEIQKLIETGSAEVTVDGSLGKAFQMEKSKKGFGEYLKGGGIVGYVIVGLGVFALLVGVFKLIEIYSFHIPRRRKLNEILDAKLSNDHEKAMSLASAVPGLSGKLVVVGMKYFDKKRRVLEDALFEQFTAVPSRLERFLPFLSLVAASAPMLGLLGTVLGIMKTFALMSEGGSTNIKFISGGISEALITTFMGLAVAIPILLVHGLLKSLAKAKTGEAEGIAMAIVNGTTELIEDEDEQVEDLAPASA